MTNTRTDSKKKIRRLTGVSLLLALAVALGLIANYVTIGTVSITLSLIPIVMGAVIYGPVAGLILGLAVGVITNVAPATLQMIAALQGVSSLPAYVVTIETVVVCLVKMGMAGLIPGLIFKALRKKHFNLGVILAGISAPIVNTGLFALFMATLMRTDLNNAYNQAGSNFAYFLFIGMIGINFIIEFAVNAILSPAMVYVSRFAFKNVNLGTEVIGKQEEAKE